MTNCIGNGSGTSLWNDYGLPRGCRLSDFLPHRIMATIGLGWEAKVLDIIKDGNWAFSTSHHLLTTIWTSITFNPNNRAPNHHVWGGNLSGNFTISSAWEKLRKKNLVNALCQLIWYPGHIPRQAFILWLATRKRMQTLDRLQ
ncbi:hypothetical protein OIU85_022427 [Salix viminalis]|uniref:Reverse transcriptase zinc-binding domain-containing protein n=1 Tax=Salix viminalis TaxID=40686 RepID=A0A9Q0U6U5_SALVM|nr:hypothetical protein OIU85_022427 [Salix viminalis]